jgi:hypothetical protein
LGKKGPKVVEVISNMTNGEGMAAECKLIILWNNDLNAKKASTRRRRRKVKKATQEGEGFGQQPTFCTVASTFESMYSSRWYGRYLRGNEEGAKRCFLSARNVSSRDTSVLMPSRSVDRLSCQ